jgi:Rrf2 family protein
MLARSPENISILEIIEALEGALTSVSCANSLTECEKNAQCAVQDLWFQIGSAVETVLKGTTLKQIASRQGHYDQANDAMYYI